MEKKEGKIEPRFRFPSYVNLRRRLGAYDAIVELNELAARSLMLRIRTDPKKLLQEESALHQIRVDHNDNLTDRAFSAKRAQFYILSVYQQAELFFDDLINDLPQGVVWKTTSGSFAKGKEEAQLDWIVRATNSENQNAFNNEVDAEFFCDVEIFTYFRLLRNAYMHEGETTRQLERQLVKVKRIYAEYLESPPEVARIKPFVVPNSYDELNFSDFILFTRVVKSIAFRLCAALKPDLNILLNHRFSPDNHHGLRKFLGNETRFATACKTRLNLDYNLTDAEISYSIPIIKSLITGS